MLAIEGIADGIVSIGPEAFGPVIFTLIAIVLTIGMIFTLFSDSFNGTLVIWDICLDFVAVC